MNFPLTESEFRQIYAKVPRLCVDVCIVEPRGVLLTKRTIAPYKNLWHIPGGTVCFGETLSAATKRIAKEELGLEIEPGQILDVLDFPDERKGDWHGWPVTIETACTIIGGEIKLDANASEARYFHKLPTNLVDTQKVFLKTKLGFEQEQLKK
jgi:ADP-ribose pyrophosphatase YjhB (NUDIX family)